MKSVFDNLLDTLATSSEDIENFKQKLACDYDLTELGSILDTKDNTLVIAAAGSGKTTSLLLKLLYDDYSNYNNPTSVTLNRPKVWVSTFLKAGALDIESKLYKLAHQYSITPFSSIYCSTMHSLYYTVLSQIVHNITIIKPTQQYQYIKQAFKLPNTASNEKIQTILSILTLRANSIDLQSPLVRQRVLEAGFELSSFQEGVIKYTQLKQQHSLYDFDDLQRIIYNNVVLQPNQKLVDFLQNQFDIFYLDEFQDISPIQYEILKVQTQKATKVFAIGDDDQTIYSWRGSDNNIILKDFRKDYNPVILQLTTNYRCPSNILQPSTNLISNNEYRYEKDIKSSQDGGEFNVKMFNSNDLMSEWVLHDIKEQVNQSHSLTILSRQNITILDLCIKLEAAGIYDYTYNSELVSLKSSKVSRFLDMPLVLLGKSQNAKSLQLFLSLLMPNVSWTQFKAKKILDYCVSSGYSFIELSEKSLKYLGVTDMKSIIAIRGLCFNPNIITYCADLLLASTYATYSYAQVFLTIVKSYNITTVDDYQLVLRNLDSRLQYHYNLVIDKGVKLSTIHSYKGLEDDYVFLLPTFGVSKDQYDSGSVDITTCHLEEERRLFYIACTRAKQYFAVYGVDKDNLFVHELGVPITFYTTNPPLPDNPLNDFTPVSTEVLFQS